MRPRLRRDRIEQHFHRWYSPGTGRYTRPDPLGLVNPNTFSPSSALGSRLEMVYGYAEMNPLLRIDAMGLRSRVCCREIPWIPGNYRHCFIQIERDGKTARCGLFGGRFTPGDEPGIGQVRPNHSFDDPGESDCGDWNESCEADQCVVDTAQSYANPSKYRVTAGPNSNTFAGTIARACKLARPAGAGRTPGWNDSPAPRAPGREPIPVECRLP